MVSIRNRSRNMVGEAPQSQSQPNYCSIAGACGQYAHAIGDKHARTMDSHLCNDGTCRTCIVGLGL